MRDKNGNSSHALCRDVSLLLEILSVPLMSVGGREAD